MSREWQPAIIVDAHSKEVFALNGVGLRPDRMALIGKRVEVAEESYGYVHSSWAPFCDSTKSFVVKGYPEFWLCEHEILSD